jgi:hypothetical protein
MSLELIQRMGIGNPILEKSMTDKIRNGDKDIFIEADDNFKEIISNNVFEIATSLELGECIVDEIKAIRKWGFVYLSDEKLDFISRNNRIFSIVPDFKYTKGENKVSTLEHITVYGSYEIRVKISDDDIYKLIIVSYIEAL